MHARQWVGWLGRRRAVLASTRRGRAETCTRAPQVEVEAVSDSSSVRRMRRCTACPLTVVRAGGGWGASRRRPRGRVRAPSGGIAGGPRACNGMARRQGGARTAGGRRRRAALLVGKSFVWGIAVVAAAQRRALARDALGGVGGRRMRASNDSSGCSVKRVAVRASSSSGRHHGAGANCSGGSNSRSRGAAQGKWGKKTARVAVVGEEEGRLRVRPVKNKQNLKIRLRIFQTT
jgi:hypothetical protein